MYESTIFAFIYLQVFASGFNPLTKEQIDRISKWTPKDKQNVWQLSGQFEGDIVMIPNNRNGLVDTKYLWTQGILVYEFDEAVTQEERNLIKSSLDVFAKETCITHKERTNEQNYIRVTNFESGCWSQVGRQGGKQGLNLQSNVCMHEGIILHSFLHALGFWHQQSATDRDEHVTIMWENIKSGFEHSFDKYNSSTITNFGAAYDYESIMHYDAYAFSSNGEKTIVTLNRADIGQRDHLSRIDNYKINMMYCS